MKHRQRESKNSQKLARGSLAEKTSGKHVRAAEKGLASMEPTAAAQPFLAACKATDPPPGGLNVLQLI